MAVSKDDREELAIGLAIELAESMPVDPDVAGVGPVEAGDQLDQGRLAAAVAPRQDDQLARPERQVDGPEQEACVVVPLTIGERHAFEANRVAQHKPAALTAVAVAVAMSFVLLRAWGSGPESVAARPAPGPGPGPTSR